MASEGDGKTTASDGAGPADSPPPTAKQKSKANASEQAIIKDARVVYGAARKNLVAFKKKDKEKELSEATVSDAMLAQFKRDIDDAEQAMNGQTVRRIVVKKATRDEVKERTSLYGLLVGARDDVKLRCPKDDPIQSAFGVGKMLKPGSTPGLLDVAGTIVEFVQQPVHKQQAIKAGVTQKRLDLIETTRDALTTADMAQAEAMGGQKEQTVTKDELFASVKKTAGYLRQAARGTFRGSPKILDQFKSKTPKHKVQPRGSKPATKTTGKGRSGTRKSRSPTQ